MGRSLFWRKVVCFCICMNSKYRLVVFFLTYGCLSEFLGFLSCVNERPFLKTDLSNGSDVPRLFKWMILTKQKRSFTEQLFLELGTFMEVSQWASVLFEGCAYLCIFVQCFALKVWRAPLSF